MLCKSEKKITNVISFGHFVIRNVFMWSPSFCRDCWALDCSNIVTLLSFLVCLLLFYFVFPTTIPQTAITEQLPAPGHLGRLSRSITKTLPWTQNSPACNSAEFAKTSAIFLLLVALFPSLTPCTSSLLSLVPWDGALPHVLELAATLYWPGFLPPTDAQPFSCRKPQ